MIKNIFCRYLQKLSIQCKWLCKKVVQLEKLLLFCRKQTLSLWFCAFLRRTLNNGVFKLCMDEEEKEKLGLKVISLKEYLFKNITASILLVFNEEIKEMMFVLIIIGVIFLRFRNHVNITKKNFKITKPTLFSFASICSLMLG